MGLATLAALATLLTGQPCAVIDNSPNRAAFAVPGQPAVSMRYTDYGDNLGYAKPVPRAAWPAEWAAVEGLQPGPPGPKLSLACV